MRTCRPDQIACGVEPGRQLALRDRPVEVVRLILLATPDHLDRHVGELLGNLDRLVDIILRAAAPAEAAAEVMPVNFTFIERNAGGFGQGCQRRLQILRRNPGIGLVGREFYRAVHHLHRGVREEGRRVDRIDLRRGFPDGLQRVAVLPIAIGGGCVEAVLELLGDRRTRLRAVRTLIPDNRERIERLLGVPPGIGDNRNGGVLDPHHLLHAGHAGDLALVVTRELAAEYRTVLDCRVEHARQLQIDGEDLAAVEFVRGVEPLERLAGELPVLWILELDGLGIRRREFCRGGSDLTITDRTLARPVGNDAVGYGQFACRDIPLVGGGLQQHQACGSAATANIILRGADPAAAAGAHFAPGPLAREIAARRDAFGRHLVPVTLQFFRHELCNAGERALPHLRARDPDHAGVVGLDRDPDVDFGRSTLRLRGVDAERHVQSERQTAARDGRRADDELAAREFCAVGKDHIFHGYSPEALRPVVPEPAARCTASRMR